MNDKADTPWTTARWRVTCGSDRSEPNGAVICLRKARNGNPILFIGVGENAEREQSTLGSYGIKFEPMTVMPTESEPGPDNIVLSTYLEIEKFCSTLTTSKADTVEACLKELHRQGSRGDARVVRIAMSCKDAVARLARIYERIKQKTLVIDRAIITGHHVMQSPYFFSKRDDRKLDFDILMTLADAYPTAAGCIRHVMLSGCNTLTEGGTGIQPQAMLLKAFPSFRTVWGYAIPPAIYAVGGWKEHEGKSPAFVPGSRTQGSIKHILRWEAATDCDPVTIPEEAYRDLAKDRPNTIAIITGVCK